MKKPVQGTMISFLNEKQPSKGGESGAAEERPSSPFSITA